MAVVMRHPAVPEPTVFPAEPWEEFGETLEEETSAAIGPYMGETYYDIPTLNKSRYQWKTSLAFFFHGIGGGAQILSTLADLLGGESSRRFVRAGRYTALGANVSGTVLLVSALHTKQRWFNMLRLFKKTSPMSIGIWAITPFGILSGLAAIAQFAESGGTRNTGRTMGRFFGIPAALLGTVVIAYMGTEQEETNMPLWASAWPLMAPLYAAAGISGGAAALTLAAELTDTPESMKWSLNRIALVSGTTELVLGTLIGNRWRRLPETRSFEGSGYAGWFRRGFLEGGVIAPLILSALDAVEGKPTGRSVLASLARLAGMLILQFVMIYGGRESGRRPRDYFEYTRPGRLEENRGEASPVGPTAGIRPARRAETVPSMKSRRLRSAVFWFSLGVSAAGAAFFLFGKRR